MAGMRYHGNVMTTTRWRLYIIEKTIITRSVYTSNSKSTVWACYRCGLHLQQYSHRLNFFLVFPDRASSYRLFSSHQLNAHFLYSITIYMLHYNPQHVSSSTMLILRRTNCIITASGIVTVCKWPYSMPVESGMQSALNRHTVQRVTVPEAVSWVQVPLCGTWTQHTA